jgi:hypothetical protein
METELEMPILDGITTTTLQLNSTRGKNIFNGLICAAEVLLDGDGIPDFHPDHGGGDYKGTTEKTQLEASSDM